jgi:hypothetical protein
LRRAAIAVVLTALLGMCEGAAAEVYWTPAHDLAPDSGLTGLAGGDLDGDGDYDLSALTLGPVRHYWNVGSPVSPEWELDLTVFPDIPSCVERWGDLGDVDSDGDLDLVLGCYYTDFLMCWNTGTPQEPQWEYDATVFESIEVWQGGSNPVMGDLDADGDLDILAVRVSGRVRRLENTGTACEPCWTDRGLIGGVDLHRSLGSAALGDIDLDGDLDLVALTPDHSPRCWENTGTPEDFVFTENPAMLSGVDEPAGGGWGVALLDIDADGDPDLVFAGDSWVNYAFLNEGTVSVEPATWSRVKALFR